MSLLPAMDAGAATRCPERSTWQSGGAVIGNTTAESDEAAEHTRRFTKMPALGMTETFGMYSWGNVPFVPEFPLATPIDELQPGFELRLSDEHGADVPDGSPGEILLRGPTVTTRLHKVDRSAAFDANGFYRTGDLAVRHGSRVSFVGRKQDMIKTSGANVSPAEVERELTAIDDVQHAFVVGLDDDLRGQLVGAAVVPTSGATLLADQIRQRLRDRLSPYKVPRAIIVLSSVDEVPMTPSMKVRKRLLAELIRSRVQAEGG
jgi:acyl-CoA synthetase (AMP-forming)/AMP-acid ligase II